MVPAVLGFIVVAYLPGALLMRAPFGRRSLRAALSADERAFWAVMLSVALSLSVTLTLASIGQYTYGRLLGLNLATCCVLGVAYRKRLFWSGEAPSPRWSAVVPLGLVALGVWLYFPPAEYVMGGKDPGVYMNEGVQIAQRGSLVVRDPVVSSVPPVLRDLFFPSHRSPDYYSVRFMGFFIFDPAQGTVVGQFPQGYPASIAIGYGLNGLSGARQAVGVWAILGLLAVYFTAARVFGRPTAAAGGVLLAINVVELWYARYPNAEMPMQALLFAALLACARAHFDDNAFFGPVSAILLVTALFVRFETVLALAGIGAGLTLTLVDRRRIRVSFVVLVIAGLLVWWPYITIWLAPYTALPIGLRDRFHPELLIPLAIIALIGLRVAARNRRLSERLRVWLPRTLAALIVALAAYGYFLRQPGGTLAPHDAMVLRTFTWYVTRPGLLAAVIGFAWAAERRFWRDPTLLSTIALFSGFFFYKIRIVPEHFWMTRRFLPVILPAVLVLAAYAAFELVGRDQLRRLLSRSRWSAPPLALTAVGAILPLLFIAGLGWQFWLKSTPVLHHVEYAGLIPRLEELTKQFGDDDLVLVEARNASDMHVLGLPLAYIYARHVLVLNNPNPNKARFRAFLEDARRRYRDVFFVGGGGTDLLSRSIAVSAVASERFQVPEYASPVNAYPEGPRMKEFDFGVYRFVPPRPSMGWFVLDVGTQDDLHVVRFHAKERRGTDTYRWTRDRSFISIVGMTADVGLVTLWLDDGRRPSTIEPAQTSVYVDDRFLGRVQVGPDFHPYSFQIPADVAMAAALRDDPARLRLETNTWNPRRALGTGDDRELGVMVDRVEAR